MDIEHWNVLLQHSQLRQCMGVLCTSVKLLTDLQILAVNCTKMRLAAGLHPDPLGQL